MKAHTAVPHPPVTAAHAIAQQQQQKPSFKDDPVDPLLEAAVSYAEFANKKAQQNPHESAAAAAAHPARNRTNSATFGEKVDDFLGEDEEGEEGQHEEEEASGLSELEREDFKEAFGHYFEEGFTSSPVPNTITVRELGFVFRALGQRMSVAELNEMMLRHGRRAPADAVAQQQQQPQQHGRGSIVGGAMLAAATSGVFGAGRDRSRSLAALPSSHRKSVVMQHPDNNNSNSNTRPVTREVSFIGGGGGGGVPGSASSGGCPLILSWDQFIELMENELQNDDSLDALGKAFDCFDVRGSGSISCKDLMLYMTRLGESTLSEDEVGRMILEADADGSGTIDRDEFIEMLRK